MCKFSIPFTSGPAALVQRASVAINQAGGTFTGDDTSGEINVRTPIGLVVGSYNISGQEIQIQIIKKPFLLSCRRIENELRNAIH